jgi:hypothetical protein
MTKDEIRKIRKMINALPDDTRLWDLDVGDLLGYVEELLDELERIHQVETNTVPCVSCGDLWSATSLHRGRCVYCLSDGY